MTVHIVPSASLPTHGPGSYVHLVWELCTTLVTHQAVVCRSESPDLQRKQVAGVEVRSVPHPAWSLRTKVGLRFDRLLAGRTAIGASSRFFRDLASHAAEFRPSTVVVWGNAAVLPFVRQALPTTRLIFAQRHYNTPGGVNNLQAADLVVFLSPSAVGYALTRLGSFHFIPLVIPNAVETDLFTPPTSSSQPEASRPTVIFPSTLTEYKGAHFLAEWLDADDRLMDVNWLVPNRIHPSCGPRLRGRLEAILPTHPNVTWLDGVRRSDMPALYRRAKLCLMPITRQEGFGLAALESMSSGVPVFATDVPALNEFIDHQETGYVVPIDQVLAKAPLVIKELHDDPGAVAALGGQARVFVEQHFPRARVLEMFEALLNGHLDRLDAGFFSAGRPRD